MSPVVLRHVGMSSRWNGRTIGHHPHHRRLRTTKCRDGLRRAELHFARPFARPIAMIDGRMSCCSSFRRAEVAEACRLPPIFQIFLARIQEGGERAPITRCLACQYTEVRGAIIAAKQGT
jgi:hypothetical protein